MKTIEIKPDNTMLLSELIDLAKGFKECNTRVIVKDGKITLEEFPF